MFKTIVLALDGSEGSKRAASLGVELARSGRAKVVIAHVEQHLAAKGRPQLYADESDVQTALRQQAEHLSKTGIEASIEITTVTAEGPAHAIAEIAARAGADLIVIGTRGHSSVAGLLVGSVTQRLLHIAHCPVLAIPPVSD